MSQIRDFKIGDYFSGVLLETFKEDRISRPRVRPLDVFPDNIRVEFPRQLREDNPLGTRFRAVVKVSQKTNKNTGKLIGVPYLTVQPSSIQLVADFSPIRQIFAIPIGDRTYEYDEFKNIKIKEVKNPLLELRKIAYNVAAKVVKKVSSTSSVYSRSSTIRAYAHERSKGVCEGCETPAPFITKNGMPYLEVHHLIPLSEGGADSPENVAAICPNCHRRTEKSKDSKKFNSNIIKKIQVKESSF